MHFKPSFNKYLSFGADRSFKAQGYQYFYAQPVQNLDCQIVILKRLTSPRWWHCLWCWGKERLQCHSVTISAPSARVVAEASWVKKAFNEKGKFNPSSSFLDVSAKAGEGADVWKPFCIVRTLSYTAPASLPQFPHPAQDPIPVLWVGFCHPLGEGIWMELAAWGITSPAFTSAPQQVLHGLHCETKSKKDLIETCCVSLRSGGKTRYYTVDLDN